MKIQALLLCLTGYITALDLPPLISTDFTQIRINYSVVPAPCLANATATQLQYNKALSGPTLMTLGYYDACLAAPDMKYFQIMWYNPIKWKYDLTQGLCVPTACSEDEIAAMVSAANPPPLQAYQIRARDPNDLKNQYKFGAGAWSFVIFIVVMIGVVTYATYHSLQEKKHRKQQKLDQLIVGNATLQRIEMTPGTMIGQPQIAKPSQTVVGTPSPSTANAPKPESPAKKEESLLGMFCAYSNMESLLHPRIVNSSVQVFELIRVIAMVWVVSGHELAYRLPISENFLDKGFYNYTQNSWFFTYNQTALYAVDLFLFVGGYVSIISLTKFIANFSKFAWYKQIVVYLFCIFKRYMRIMPAFGLLLWYNYVVVPTLIKGPNSQLYISNNPCNSRNFLEGFLLGYNASITQDPKLKMCAGWTWYLVVDFRIFITIPIILIVSKGNKYIGMGLCAFLAVVSLVWTFITCFKDNVTYINLFDPNQTWSTYYYASAPQRSVVYYMGAIFAYLTTGAAKKKPAPAPVAVQEPLNEDGSLERKKKKRIAKIKMMQNIYLAIGLALVVGMTLLLHYVFQYGRNVPALGEFKNSLFIAFGKMIFVVGLMMSLLILGFKFKSFGNYVAKSTLLQLIGNLSFPMYLFHFTFIMIRTYSINSLPTMAGYDLFAATLTELPYTMVLALMCSLLVELPVSHIWRVYCEGHLLNLVKKL